MRNIVIDQKGCQLSYDRQLLLLKHPSFTKPISVPFGQIQSLTVVTAVDISSNLLTKLSEHHIATIIVPSSRVGTPCILHGGWHAGVLRRRMQHEIIRDVNSCSQWATLLVKLKIHNHYQLLYKILVDCHGYPNLYQQCDVKGIEKALGQLRLSRRRLKTYFLRHINLTCPQTLITPQYDVASLRGVEGSAAAIFFGQYQQFFDNTLGFNQRNRRPPKDPVNTLLSLGYTLLQGLCEQAVYTVGFDPHLGILHEISYGRQSLACDFAELQRHEIEYWVWQLFAHETITLADFSIDTNAQRPCELLKAGRSRFYEAWSLIKPRLQKQVHQHVWLWYRRIEGQFEFTGADAAMKASLEFVSETL